MRSPSIFVWCDAWLVQVASNFPCFDHRPSGSLQWKHGLHVYFETFSSWDQSTSDYWMYFTYISDCSGNSTLSCNARSTTLPPECPWIAWKYKEVLIRVSVQAILKPFLWSSSLCHKSYPIVNWPLRSTIELCIDVSILSSNRTAPSSSRGIHGSCRSNLIMAFDTVKQPWRNLTGLISIQFLSRQRIEMVNSVIVGFGRGFAFAKGIPVTWCSTFSRETVSDVSVTHLSIPFTIQTLETVLSRNKDSTMISIP